MTVRSGLRLQLLMGGALLAITAAPAVAQTAPTGDSAQTTPAG